MVKFIGGSKIEKNDELYTNEQTVELMFNLLNPAANSTVICPFDTDKSNFVKHGLKSGYKMLYGMQDWLDKDYDYDYLITNPPFSIKDDVIAKCFQSGKPSALVLPIDALGGKRRHGLYAKYNYPTIYVPSKRINYITMDGKQTKANYFHSVILILNDPLGSRLLWE